MNCQNCGSEINKGSKFCRKCGEPVDSYHLTGVNSIKRASRTIAIFAVIIAVISFVVSIVTEVNSPKNVVENYIQNFCAWDSYKVYSLTSKKLRDYEIEKYFNGSMVEYRDAIDNLSIDDHPWKTGSIGWEYVSTSDLSRGEIEELEVYYENKINITKAKKVVYEICGSSVIQEHLSEIIVIKEGLSWKVFKELHSIIGVEDTTQTVYSLDYMGTWYGFGTSGNEDAQFEIEIRPHDRNTVYVSKKGWGTNYRLEETETKIMFSSSGQAREISAEQQIMSFSFYINKNGKEEMKIEFVDNKSGKQLAESIYAGRTPKRDEALGEIYKEAEGILSSYPSKKDDFQNGEEKNLLIDGEAIADTYSHNQYSDNYFLEIYSYDGRNIEFGVTAYKGRNAAQVAQIHIFDSVVNGVCEFEFTDNFDNVGSGILRLYDNGAELSFNVPRYSGAGWCVDAAKGSYVKD